MSDSVDIASSHLKTSHVVAIVVAVLTAGAAVASTYYSMKWDIQTLNANQAALATKKDIAELKPALETYINGAVSERVKFYIQHAGIECDLSRGVADKARTPCRFRWPLPDP